MELKLRLFYQLNENKFTRYPVPVYSALSGTSLPDHDTLPLQPIPELHRISCPRVP